MKTLSKCLSLALLAFTTSSAFAGPMDCTNGKKTLILITGNDGKVTLVNPMTWVATDMRPAGLSSRSSDAVAFQGIAVPQNIPTQLGSQRQMLVQVNVANSLLHGAPNGKIMFEGKFYTCRTNLKFAH